MNPAPAPAGVYTHTHGRGGAANSAAAVRRQPQAGISPRHHQPDASEGEAPRGLRRPLPLAILGLAPTLKPLTHLPTRAPRVVLSSDGVRGVGAASGLEVVGTTGITMYIQAQIHVISAARERD